MDGDTVRQHTNSLAEMFSEDQDVIVETERLFGRKNEADNGINRM
jgi:hypothetical protein